MWSIILTDFRSRLSGLDDGNPKTKWGGLSDEDEMVAFVSVAVEKTNTKFTKEEIGFIVDEMEYCESIHPVRLMLSYYNDDNF